MATHIISRMAVEVDGTGDPVVFLHGLGGTSNTFAAVMSAFSRFQTIRIDLPGAGRSNLVEGPISIASLVRAVELVLGHLGIGKAHFVGHSMGTIVAAHIAANSAAKSASNSSASNSLASAGSGSSTAPSVRSLLLFGPLLCPPEPARSSLKLRAQKARSEGATGMQAIADALLQASTSAESKRSRFASVAFVRESLMRQCPDGYARNCEALAEAQAANTSLINCPALLVTGDEDVVAPPQAVRQMSEKIVGSRMEVLRGCGHWTPIEMPAECSQLASQFFSQRFA
jgi:3-oxoadipate enol-lactonase